MRDWKFWDWVAYATISVVALQEAISAGSNRMPDFSGRFPLMYAEFWSYTPLALMSIATAILVIRALRSQIGTPPKPEHSPRAASREVRETSERPTTWNTEVLRRALGSPPDLQQPEGTPNATLIRTLSWIADSVWAEQHSELTKPLIETELVDKLHMARLTAFGRRESAGPIEPISYKLWGTLVIDSANGTANVRGNDSPAYYGLQFDFDQVSRLWPHKRSWMAN